MLGLFEPGCFTKEVRMKIEDKKKAQDRLEARLAALEGRLSEINETLRQPEH